MANGAYRTSELPQTTTMAGTDRVVILYNATGNPSVGNGSPGTRTISLAKLIDAGMGEVFIDLAASNSFAIGNASSNLFINSSSIYISTLEGTTFSVSTNGVISGNGSSITSVQANNINGLATIATSGSYNDLNNVPSFAVSAFLDTSNASNINSGSLGAGVTILGTFAGTANDTTYVGGVPAANIVSNAQLSANLATYQTTAGLSANVATLTANSAAYIGTLIAANVVSNTQLSSNLGNYQTTAGLSANVATLTANNASYIGGLIAANVVSNTQLSSNLGNYQTTAGLSANIATLTANAAYYANNLVAGRTTVMERIVAPASANITVGTYPLLWTQNAITIAEVVIVIQNTAATAWASSGVYWGSTLGTQQNVVFAAANNSNITTGVHTTSFTNATMAANTWLWANVSTVSNVTTLTIAVRY